MPGLCVQPLDFLLLLHSILPDEVHHLAIPILGHRAVRHKEDLVNVIFLNPLKHRAKCCKDSLSLYEIYCNTLSKVLNKPGDFCC